MPTLLHPPSIPLYHSYRNFHTANLSEFLFWLAVSKFHFGTQGWISTDPVLTLRVNEMLCSSLTYSARQPFLASTGACKWGLTVSNLYFVNTPHAFLLKLWNFILNPQAFVGRIHSVFLLAVEVATYQWAPLYLSCVIFCHIHITRIKAPTIMSLDVVAPCLWFSGQHVCYDQGIRSSINAGQSKILF
jgi:hypothetical protein